MTQASKEPWFEIPYVAAPFWSSCWRRGAPHGGPAIPLVEYMLIHKGALINNAGKRGALV